MHTNNLQFIWLCALCEAKSQKISHSIAKLTKWQERARIPENLRRYCGRWLSSVCLCGNERIQHRGRRVILHRCIRPRTNQEHHYRREHLSSLPGFLVHLFCPSQFFFILYSANLPLHLWFVLVKYFKAVQALRNVPNLEVHSFQCYIIFFVYFEYRSHRRVSCTHKKV